MSLQKILISGGKIIDPKAGIEVVGPLCIADGKIAAVDNIPSGFNADQEIVASGKIVCPGFIDLCARLREPGQEHKASISSECHAAVRAGIVALCCPPDTKPVIDTPAVVELIKDEADRVGMCKVIPVGALTQKLAGDSLSEMFALKRSGCIAVSNAHHPIASTLVLRRAMEYAASYDLLVVICPKDPDLWGNGCIHEGEVSTRLGLTGIPDTAETVAVAQALPLVAQIGARVHFSQLSCAGSVRLIELARLEDLPVTADVSAHQLHLTEKDVLNFDTSCHVIPPLRSQRDLDYLRSGVAKGIVSAVCSDHQPHEQGAKLDVFASSEPGVSALETLLPLTLGLVDKEELTLMQAIAALTSGPASVLGTGGGGLAIGEDADISVFDPGAIWTVSQEQWWSRGLNTPFWGKQMVGQVTQTLIGGKVVYDINRDIRKSQSPTSQSA